MKHKAKLIAPIPKSPAEIKLKGEFKDAFIALCEYHRPEYETIDKFLDYVTVNYVDPEEALFPLIVEQIRRKL
jgi:hypothetical protein